MFIKPQAVSALTEVPGMYPYTVYFNKTFGKMICGHCNRIQDPKKLVHHLKNHAVELNLDLDLMNEKVGSIEKTLKKCVTDFMKDQEGVDFLDLDEEIGKSVTDNLVYGIPPVEGLMILEGYACNKCNYVGGQEKTMSKHLRLEHKMECVTREKIYVMVTSHHVQDMGTQHKKYVSVKGQELEDFLAKCDNSVLEYGTSKAHGKRLHILGSETMGTLMSWHQDLLFDYHTRDVMEYAAGLNGDMVTAGNDNDEGIVMELMPATDNGDTELNNEARMSNALERFARWSIIAPPHKYVLYRKMCDLKSGIWKTDKLNFKIIQNAVQAWLTAGSKLIHTNSHYLKTKINAGCRIKEFAAFLDKKTIKVYADLGAKMLQFVWIVTGALYCDHQDKEPMPTVDYDFAKILTDVINVDYVQDLYQDMKAYNITNKWMGYAEPFAVVAWSLLNEFLVIHGQHFGSKNDAGSDDNEINNVHNDRQWHIFEKLTDFFLNLLCRPRSLADSEEVDTITHFIVSNAFQENGTRRATSTLTSDIAKLEYIMKVSYLLLIEQLKKPVDEQYFYTPSIHFNYNNVDVESEVTIGIILNRDENNVAHLLNMYSSFLCREDVNNGMPKYSFKDRVCNSVIVTDLKDCVVSLDDLRKAVSDGLRDLNKLLDFNLYGFETDNVIPLLSDVFDNLGSKVAFYNFIVEQQNDLTRVHEKFVVYLLKKMPNIFVTNSHECSRFCLTCQSILELFGFLFQLTAGMPYRGSVWIGTRLRNSTTILRNIMVSLVDKLTFIHSYDKSESRKQTNIYCAKYVAKELERPFLVYLLLLRPLESTFMASSAHCTGRNKFKLYQNFLFVTDYKIWTVEAFRSLFVRLFHKYTNISFRFQDYRHIVKLFEGKWIPTEVTHRLVRPLDTTVDAQFGHSHTTGEGYGVQYGASPFLSAQKLSAMFDLSNAWQQLLGLNRGKESVQTSLTLKEPATTTICSKKPATITPNIKQKTAKKTVDTDDFTVTTVKYSKEETKLIVAQTINNIDAEWGQQEEDTLPTDQTMNNINAEWGDVCFDDFFGDVVAAVNLNNSFNMLIDNKVQVQTNISKNYSDNLVVQVKHALDYDLIKRKFSYLHAFRDNYYQNAFEAMFNSASAEQKNFLIIFPTGVGKSVFFRYPPLLETKVTFVIFPLVALYMDQLKKSHDMGISFCSFNKNTPISIYERERLVLVRIEDFGTALLETLTSMASVGTLGRVIVDECHTVLLHQDFRPVMSQVMLLQNIPITKVFLTATLPSIYRQDFLEYVGISQTSCDTYCRGSIPNNLVLTRLNCDNLSHACRNIVEITNTTTDPARSIVYCLTDQEAQFCHKNITGSCLYTGKYNNIRRNESISQWSTPGSLYRIMVATTAFAAGVDYAHVRHVFIMKATYTLIDFVQMAGRGGRFADTIAFVHLVQWRGCSIAHGIRIERQMRDYIKNKTTCCRLLLNNYLYDNPEGCQDVPSNSICWICHDMVTITGPSEPNTIDMPLVEADIATTLATSKPITDILSVTGTDIVTISVTPKHGVVALPMVETVRQIEKTRVCNPYLSSKAKTKESENLNIERSDLFSKTVINSNSSLESTEQSTINVENTSDIVTIAEMCKPCAVTLPVTDTSRAIEKAPVSNPYRIVQKDTAVSRAVTLKGSYQKSGVASNNNSSWGSLQPSTKRVKTTNGVTESRKLPPYTSVTLNAFLVAPDLMLGVYCNEESVLAAMQQYEETIADLCPVCFVKNPAMLQLAKHNLSQCTDGIFRCYRCGSNTCPHRQLCKGREPFKKMESICYRCMLPICVHDDGLFGNECTKQRFDFNRLLPILMMELKKGSVMTVLANLGVKDPIHNVDHLIAWCCVQSHSAKKTPNIVFFVAFVLLNRDQPYL